MYLLHKVMIVYDNKYIIIIKYQQFLELKSDFFILLFYLSNDEYYTFC